MQGSCLAQCEKRKKPIPNENPVARVNTWKKEHDDAMIQGSFVSKIENFILHTKRSEQCWTWLSCQLVVLALWGRNRRTLFKDLNNKVDVGRHCRNKCGYFEEVVFICMAFGNLIRFIVFKAGLQRFKRLLGLSSSSLCYRH